MPVLRSPENPLITPADVRPSRADFEILSVINAGVARLGAEVILLLRVVERPINARADVYLCPIWDAASGQVGVKEFPRGLPGYDFSDPRGIVAPEGSYLTAISHLRVARSTDGIHFQVADRPAMSPANAYEAYGLEDPRISRIGDTFFINYVAASAFGIVTCLAQTRDFETFERMGVIFLPDNKDVVIFPERIHGQYYALNRPCISGLGKPEIWLAQSPDLHAWGSHRHLLGVRANGWEDARIGGSAVPVRIPEGWLVIYHGASHENHYSLGALLLDAHDPGSILGRSGQPFLTPQADYEINGFFQNVVFTCGALFEDGLAKIYYGAADTSIAYAEIPVSEILQTLL